MMRINSPAMSACVFVLALALHVSVAIGSGIKGVNYGNRFVVEDVSIKRTRA